MKSPHIPALWVMLIIVVVRLAQSQTSSDELQKGVEAYKNARFEEALQHFKNVIAVDGGNLNGHLYLATALAQQYIPGAETPDNNKNGKEAVDEYQKVLELDSRNLPAVNGIAYLKLQMKQFVEAKEYYEKAIALDPNDAELYYSIGVIVDPILPAAHGSKDQARLGVGRLADPLR